MAPLAAPHRRTHGRHLCLRLPLYACYRWKEAGQSGCIPTHSLLDLAHRWSEADGVSHRTCPLCRALPGTPRHAVMSCPAMLPVVSLLRDDMEAELLRLANPARHMAAVQHQHLVQARSPTNDDGRRWPILATWQWLVPMCTEVNDFGVEPGNSSAASTLAEGASDLAHRGIMPCGTGKSPALCYPTPLAGHIRGP